MIRRKSHYTTLRGKLSDLVAIGFNFDLIGSDYDASFSRPIKTKQGLINKTKFLTKSNKTKFLANYKKTNVRFLHVENM